MTTLAELEDRVAALEVQDEAGSPNYLSIGAGGLIGASFSGSVAAQGVTLPVSTVPWSGLPINPTNVISWIRKPGDNAIVAQIGAIDQSNRHDLLLQSFALPEGPSRPIFSSVGIIASDAPGNTLAGLQVAGGTPRGSNPLTQAGPSTVTATAGSAATTVLDDTGSSTFVQNANPATQRVLSGDPLTLFLNANSAPCPAAAWFNYMTIAANVVWYDPGGRWNSGAGGYQCRNAGAFYVSGAFAYPATGTTAWSCGAGNSNTGGYFAASGVTPAAVGVGGGSFSVIIAANAGDILVPQAWLSGSLAINSGGNGARLATYFSVVQVM